VRAAGYLIWLLARLYLLVLVARIVLDLVMAFSRTWRPGKTVAALAEIVFMVTDPPLRWLRRVIRPIRVGSVAFDLAFLVLFAGVSVVAYVAAFLAG
jgi:YggT family protein